MEGIRQAGEEKRADLKEYLQSAGPAVNYKKSEQVWDNYYKTMFTLKTVASDIRGTREDAAEIIKKVSEDTLALYKGLALYLGSQENLGTG